MSDAAYLSREFRRVHGVTWKAALLQLWFCPLVYVEGSIRTPTFVGCPLIIFFLVAYPNVTLQCDSRFATQPFVDAGLGLA